MKKNNDKIEFLAALKHKAWYWYDCSKRSDHACEVRRCINISKVYCMLYRDYLKKFKDA